MAMFMLVLVIYGGRGDTISISPTYMKYTACQRVGAEWEKQQREQYHHGAYYCLEVTPSMWDK